MFVWGGVGVVSVGCSESGGYRISKIPGLTKQTAKYRFVLDTLEGPTLSLLLRISKLGTWLLQGILYSSSWCFFHCWLKCRLWKPWMLAMHWPSCWVWFSAPSDSVPVWAYMQGNEMENCHFKKRCLC